MTADVSTKIKAERAEMQAVFKRHHRHNLNLDGLGAHDNELSQEAFQMGLEAERTVLKDLQSDHRALMRAAFNFCNLMEGFDTSVIMWTDWEALWKLCKDYDPTEK